MPLNHTSKYSQLTDFQFLLIRKLTVEFSNIEFLLSEILSRLLVTPSFLARTYADRMNVNSLIEKIINAIDIHQRRYEYSIFTEFQCQEIIKIVKEIDELRKVRNKFAHYCWSRHTDEEIFGTEFNGKQANPKKTNAGAIVITNNEIEELYNNAYLIVDKLNSILDKLPEIVEDKELKSKLNYK